MAISPRFAQRTRLNGRMRAALRTAESVVSGGTGVAMARPVTTTLARALGRAGGMERPRFTPLYAEQQIHGRLIRGGKTVVLEFARGDPAAVGDPHRVGSAAPTISAW